MKNAKSKSVNPKSLAARPESWRKYSFYFDTQEDCNRLALPLAACMRGRVPKVYFARYNNATEHRVDLYFAATTPLPKNDILAGLKKEMRWHHVIGPVACEGSDAHAAGFDAVLRLAHALNKLPVETQRGQWCDVIHWMHNMFGIDYVDEIRCSLHAIHCIASVFDNSIKLGNRMVKAAKKLRRN